MSGIGTGLGFYCNICIGRRAAGKPSRVHYAVLYYITLYHSLLLFITL
jgi:hypothetical protein